MSDDIISVSAAAIVNNNNEVLITRRYANAHQGGLWEFPGGKLEPGESAEQALIRELREELNITVTAFRPLISVSHHYPDKCVRLHVFKVMQYNGEPSAMEGQPMKWQAVDALNADEFPTADKPVINALKLPERYMITGAFESLVDFDARLQHALNNGIQLVQLRLKPDWLNKNRALAGEVMQRASDLCRQQGAYLMMNIPDELAIRCHYDGVHADSRKLQTLQQRPASKWFSVSCHTADDLLKAEQLEADFVVLSPVRYTNSHPDAEPLGWQKFEQLVEQVNIPVYALGGVDASHINTANQAGAQGVAGIGAFWKKQQSD